ncbi:hypothetical protein BGW42_006742 [Actinomortierella wolfii]|nr:hypothetical protein BGW42_006742 [Actinomortierella wolfii]
MSGSHDIVFNQVDLLLLEHSFGRIKIIHGQVVTVMDDPFVSKAVENHFIATDPYFKKEIRKTSLMHKMTKASDHGKDRGAMKHLAQE